MPSFTHCVSILLLWGGICSAEDAPQAGSSSVLPYALTLSRSLNFPEGRVAEATMSQMLNLNLRGKVDAALRYNGQSRTVCESAVTDSGEDLLLPAQEGNDRRMPPGFRRRNMMMGRGNELFPDSLNLKYPLKPAKTISVSGAVILTCESKAGEVHELDFASDARPSLEIDGLAISAEKPADASQCKVTTANALEDRIKSVEFVDADGGIIEGGGYSGTGDGKSMIKTYRLRAGKAVARIRFTLIGPEVEVRVPFAFKDLPLEAPLASERPQRALPLPTAPVPPPQAKNDF